MLWPGAPDYHSLMWPYSVAADSRGRIIVDHPMRREWHIFDFAQQKCKFISRKKGKNSLVAPQCVAVDAKDNIYVRI